MHANNRNAGLIFSVGIGCSDDGRIGLAVRRFHDTTIYAARKKKNIKKRSRKPYTPRSQNKTTSEPGVYIKLRKQRVAPDVASVDAMRYFTTMSLW